MVCSVVVVVSAMLEVDDGVGATDVEEGARVFQSLTVQSREVERTRSPRSTGPRAGWESRDMTGAVWPLYLIRASTPALAPARS